jgi:bifunctional non-homologous end joining protein LigD
VFLPRLNPLELAVGREPVNDPDWIYELKYDVFRALAYYEHGRVELVSPSGNLYPRFGDLCTSLEAELHVDAAILDGEICCFDSKGFPEFDEIFSNRGTPCFVVFDLLNLNGIDFRPKPLLVRKSVLSHIAPLGSRNLLLAHHVLEHGVELYAAACRRNLEGIVAKHGQAPYALIGGRSPWIEIRNPAYRQRRETGTTET